MTDNANVAPPEDDQTRPADDAGAAATEPVPTAADAPDAAPAGEAKGAVVPVRPRPVHVTVRPSHSLSELIGGAGFAKLLDTGALARQIAAFPVRQQAMDVLLANLRMDFSGLDVMRRTQWKLLSESVLTTQLRVLDQITPAVLMRTELGATANIAKLFAADSALAGARMGLFAAQVAPLLAASSQFRLQQMPAGLLADLVRMSDVNAQLAQAAVHIRPASASVVKGRAWPSSRPAIALGTFVASLPSDAPPADLELAVDASYSVSSLLTVDVLTGDSPRQDVDLARGRFTDDVLPSWARGPAHASFVLYERLEALDPRLPALLEGAWDEVRSRGAAADVKLATCAVEALEWTLRTMAPTEEVLDWHRRTGRPASELDTRGGPTFGCRVRWLFRDPTFKNQRRLVGVETEALVIQTTELRSRFQAGKHADAVAFDALRAYLVSLEGLLHQLLLGAP